MSVTHTFPHRRRDLSVVRLDALDGAAPAAVARSDQYVVHQVEPWSVFRISLAFYGCVCAVLLVAGVLLWAAAAVTGLVGNVESFMQSAGFDAFRFRPVQLLRAFTLLGVILVVTGTLANVLLATLFNLISEHVGGVRVTLLEDHTSPTER